MSLEYREEPDLDREEPVAHPVRIPAPVYTVILVLCIAAVMLAQLYAGLERSIDIAGFVKPDFVSGAYWRILTGAVVHGSLLHVFMNGYALYALGRLMELLTNRAHLAIVFLLSAVGGGLLSLFFNPFATSVGASGGIIGLLGYLLIYAFRRRQFVSADFRKSLLINTGFILVFGLVLYEVVDNYGHLGGFITGFLYGFIQIPSDAYKNPGDAGIGTRVLGVVALAIAVGTATFAIILLVSGR